MLTLEEFNRLSQEEKLRRCKELSYRDMQHIQMTCDPGAHRGVCNDCHQYTGLAKCTVYPNGIPREILLHGVRKISLPDNTIPCFEPKEDDE